MSVAALLPLPISKEVRALAIPWLACLVCMLVPAIVDAPLWLVGLSVPAYFLGASALGALSIGHEYTDRTLSLLLTLPARRERLFAIKLGVLAGMLLTLWVVAYTAMFGDVRLPQTSKDAASLLPVLCGLCLAPWLTMACRNPVAGTVFTLAIPGTLLVIGELLGVARYGHGSVMEAFRLAFVWLGTLGVCAIGAVMSWWTLMRLEALEGPGHDARLPYSLRSWSTESTAAPTLTRGDPFWLLVRKELRLQQLPLVLAALYTLGWLSAAWSTTLVPGSAYGDAFATPTFIHAGLLAMLIGSSASAGERQMGTLEWQVLLPISASQQWAVKAGVALGLAMVLALGLPSGLLYLSHLIRNADPLFSLRAEMVVFIFLLTSGSLYVSSLCRSGLWALLMSIPATLGAWLFLKVTMNWVGISWFSVTRIPTVLTLLIIGFIAILLRFALTNHRFADRPAWRVWKQVVLMAAFVTAGVITLAALQTFHR